MFSRRATRAVHSAWNRQLSRCSVPSVAVRGMASTADEVSDFPTSKVSPYRKPAGDTTRRAFSYMVVGGLGMGLASGVKAIAVRFCTLCASSADQRVCFFLSARFHVLCVCQLA